MNSALLSMAGLLAVLLAGRLWVAMALFGTGITLLFVFRDLPVDRILAQSYWNITTSPGLLALPLFILMAEILHRSHLSGRLFNGLAPWVVGFRGGLLHANVLGCTLFAAVSGSSAATVLTIGRVNLDELFARGYDRRLAIGSLAGAGTLGFLIPPSLIMIIYGVLSGASITALFIAGVLPGLLLALGYALVIMVSAGSVPSTDEARRSTWRERLAGLRDILPAMLLILVVLGSLYGGIASPTEAAAVGVLGAVVTSALQGTLTKENLTLALAGAVRTMCMGIFIVAAGFFFSVVLAYLQIPQSLLASVAGWNLSPLQLILLLMLFYLALGLILDGTSTIIMTLPVVLPLVTGAGFDLIWFGIFLILVVEMAQITPPVGFNLFVIQSLTGESVGRIARYAFPFFLVTLAMTLLVIFFPEIATFLPGRMLG